jgi:nanoRNase/pAp phosphatase (c-di-AMP/oligoRNAs hydrolase)
MTEQDGKKAEKTTTQLRNGVKALSEALEDLSKKDGARIAIFSHGMPDPDAIASMMGMRWLCIKKYGIDADIFYAGEVAHPQNSTMVNLLDLAMIRVDDKEKGYKVGEYDYHILCDTIPSHAGVGDFKISFDVMIDHHKEIPHDFKGIIIHRKVGSCASIVYDVIKQLVDPESDQWFDDDVDYDSKVATALIAGVMTDCNFCLADDSTELDRAAVNELFEYRNSGFLHQIVFFKRPKFWITVKAMGCREADINEEGFAIVGLGLIPAKERDLIADMAEEMITWASVETAVAFGIVDGDRIEGSVRSNNASISVHEFCKKLGGRDGSGGGKHGRGAYRMPMSPPIDTDEDAEDVQETWEAIKKREMKRIRRIIKK